MAKQKLSIIGGGSAYVPGIIYSVAHAASDLDGMELCLMDISTERLPMIAKLGERICKEAGTKIKVTHTTDRKVALANATFITDDNPEMPAYGGRYSVKSLLRIELRMIPQEPPSIFVDDGLGTGWLSDPESADTCNGCHVRKGTVNIPVDCAQCHTMP